MFSAAGGGADIPAARLTSAPSTPHGRLRFTAIRRFYRQHNPWESEDDGGQISRRFHSGSQRSRRNEGRFLLLKRFILPAYVTASGGKKMSTLKWQNALCVFLAFTLKEIVCSEKTLLRPWVRRKRRMNLSSEALNELCSGSSDLLPVPKTNTTRHMGWNVVYLLGKSCGMTLCV